MNNNSEQLSMNRCDNYYLSSKQHLQMFATINKNDHDLHSFH